MHKYSYVSLACILLVANVCERQRKLPQPAAAHFTVAGQATPQAISLADKGKAQITLTIAPQGAVGPGAKYHLKTWSLPLGLHGALTDMSGNALSSVTLPAGEHRLFYQPFNAGEHVLTLVWTDAHHAQWQTLQVGPITALQAAGQPAAEATRPPAPEGPTEVKKAVASTATAPTEEKKALASTATAPAEEKKAPAKAVEGPDEQKKAPASEGAVEEQVAKKASTSGGSVCQEVQEESTSRTCFGEDGGIRPSKGGLQEQPLNHSTVLQ